MSKKLNAVTLSGLMIGPILGSGILFLPPLAYKNLGENAMIAWIITMLMGVLFAYVFSRMNAAAPDNQGASVIITQTLGKRAGALSANYLTTAVLFGPTAVALTAADFIGALFPNSGLNQTAVAGIILLTSALIVISNIIFMGKILLVLSSLTGCLLLGGSLVTLFHFPVTAFPFDIPKVEPFGKTLLLLFWSIFGWEVLGSYTEDIADSERTTMRAMKISLAAIISVYLTAALALQQSKSDSMATLLSPLFGSYSAAIFGLIAAGLCICTIVTFTGAVTRQTTARLQTLRVPALLKNNKSAVFALVLLNLIVLLCFAAGWLSFEAIVKSANCLFIGNAFLGLFSGFRLMRNIYIRISIAVLLFMMLVIFLYSPIYAIGLFAFVTLFSLLTNKAVPLQS